MTTWLVTRHPGAIEWAARQQLVIERHVEHLDPVDIQPGDTVIGILPVNLAAEVYACGGRYINRAHVVSSCAARAPRKVSRPVRTVQVGA